MIFLHDAPATSFCQASSGLQCFFMEIFGNLAQKGSFVEVVVWYFTIYDQSDKLLQRSCKKTQLFSRYKPENRAGKVIFFLFG